MPRVDFRIDPNVAAVVGSFGSPADLSATAINEVRAACDLAEIRLDVLAAAGSVDPSAWRHLSGIPLLFTARRREEGGAGDLDPAGSMKLLETALDDAAVVDIEVARIPAMQPLIDILRARSIPWVASYHDFEKLPANAVLEEARAKATAAGASCFKLAARMQTPNDIARLAEFQSASTDIPVATMGMGALAPVSRLLCAQCGSVLNYGFIGTTPTAPGQWDAAFLKQAIAKLAK